MARRKQIDLWAGARATKGITRQHRPLLWEMMLGTVKARNPEGETKYFDYEYERAHEWIELKRYTDLRVCRAKHETYEGPRAKQFALFGVLTKTQP